LAGRRILIVEDEYFLADDMSRMLCSIGAEIAGPASDIDDALRMLEDGASIDGAVLDVKIRGDMAFPIARELRARHVPFVFATGYEKVTLGTEFQDVRLWEKPIDIAAMIRGLAEMVERRTPHAQTKT
jgi:CheY-like chemotaxis protein